jgi:hypothetical protein
MANIAYHRALARKRFPQEGHLRRAQGARKVANTRSGQRDHGSLGTGQGQGYRRHGTARLGARARTDEYPHSAGIKIMDCATASKSSSLKK